MSIPSNESLAKLSIRLAHEFYDHIGKCSDDDCGKRCFPEMHEIYGRQMRPILGSTVCILGLTLVPLCKECHIKWDNYTEMHQLRKLGWILMHNGDLMEAQCDQLIALRARCHRA